MQHFKFPNSWIRAFVFWCHEQVTCLLSFISVECLLCTERKNPKNKTEIGWDIKNRMFHIYDGPPIRKVPSRNKHDGVHVYKYSIPTHENFFRKLAKFCFFRVWHHFDHFRGGNHAIHCFGSKKDKKCPQITARTRICRHGVTNSSYRISIDPQDCVYKQRFDFCTLYVPYRLFSWAVIGPWLQLDHFWWNSRWIEFYT